MKLIAWSLILSLFGVAAIASTPSSQEFIRKLNRDSDSTLEPSEITPVASARFDAADTNHDGTVEKGEISKLKLTRTDLKKIHVDTQGAVTREEYLKFIQSLFTKADKDHDGSLSAAELDSSSGHELRRLLQ